MDSNVIIESYVSDVVGRLPRRQRGDVGLELRSLLGEELTGRAVDLGRPPDEPMVMDLLAGFGRPQDVADRYRPPGFTVIRPADAPRFAWVALGGVALQWAVTLPAVFTGTTGLGASIAAGGSGDWLMRLSVWWLSWGLGSFWWPGLLISLTLIAALIRHRRASSTDRVTDPKADPGTRTGWTPTSVPRSVLNRDRVSRPWLLLVTAFWAVGATVLIALPLLPTLSPALPQPLLDAFVLDPAFLRRRAPWVLLLWVATFAVGFAVLLAGRTGSGTRRVSVAIDTCWLALLTWSLAAGPIFTAPATDAVVRVCLVGIIMIVVIDLVATVRREAAPTRTPVA